MHFLKRLLKHGGQTVLLSAFSLKWISVFASRQNVPGQSMILSPVDMVFNYAEAYHEEEPEAYETLLEDVMEGMPLYLCVLTR